MLLLEVDSKWVGEEAIVHIVLVLPSTLVSRPAAFAPVDTSCPILPALEALQGVGYSLLGTPWEGPRIFLPGA